MENRTYEELEKIYKDIYFECFKTGFFNAQHFVNWLFKQDLEVLDHVYYRFSKMSHKEAKKIGCEYVEYVMVHYELVNCYLSPN